MKLTSYWQDTATPHGDYRRTPVPEQVDVAIVGGGLTGTSAAVALRQRGASVVVLEQHTIGWGASGRNGGMATTGLAIGFAAAVKRYGAERAVAMFGAYNDAIDHLEKLVTEHAIDCDFERSGKLTLAYRPAHFDAMRRTQRTLQDLADYEVVTVAKADLHTEVGTDYYHGATVDPLAAGLHVGKFVNGLAKVAADLGATVCENAEATVLAGSAGAGHLVQTSRGQLRAAQVLIATSGYTGRLTPWLRRRLIPVGSFVIVTEPLPTEVVDRILPHRRQASDSKNLIYYFRITPDNRLLFGGRARFAMSSPDSDMKSGQVLYRAMVELFPYLTGTKVDYTWGGLVDLSMDQMVHAGERDGVYYSLGYSGHGVQMATYMGLRMAQLMSGDRTANPWADLAFPPVPGHYGRPWFLPLIGGGARLLDSIK
jgi:glycine/D-amino acid oxidase-like deaminating enzyme